MLSLITVTLDGSHGSCRDHFTRRSPIFGNRNFRPTVMLKRAFRVNRIAWRLSWRDRNFGAPSFAPFRFPALDWRKLR